MIDRAIGIIGIALALLTGAASRYLPELPSGIEAAGYAIGVLLLGISIGLISAGGLRKRRVRSNASLRLHLYGDHRTPDLLAQENIFRWYYLQTAVNGVTPEGNKRLATFATLFVSFDDDVVIHTLQVRSPDAQLPVYEVKEFNQRYAIIVFHENVPAGTLEVRATA